MPNGKPGPIAGIAVTAGVLIIVLGIYAPSLLGLVIPIALVLIGITAKTKQDKLRAAGQAAPTHLPQGQPAQQAQQAWSQPARQAPPVMPAQQPAQPQWWASQAFPTTSAAPVQQPVPTPPPPPPVPADPENITVPPELHAKVEVLRKTGKTVEAIDLLREETGMELYPASRYVLAIEVP